jgi:zinc D-Ala-D-Ala carboxypeptidase
VGRRRAAPERQRTLLGTVGAVTALGIAAGAVAITQALPQRAEAATAARVAVPVSDARPAPAARPATTGTGTTTGPERMRPAVPRPAVTSAAAAQLAREPRTPPVSRSRQRTAPAWCDGKPPTREYANGRIPLRELCRLPFDKRHRLRADAAVAFDRLNTAFQARFGDELCLTDSYRSYASQVSVAARKPALAARPGTSEHGWGLAADLCEGAAVPGARQHVWLLAHAPAFGWDNPKWARPNGSRPEAWHWEYVAGE